VFAFVKGNLSGAKRTGLPLAGKGGAGKGGRPCPASAHSDAGALRALQTLTVKFRIADDSPAESSSTQVVGASVLR